jgi:alpha-1,3-fucosyltransferase
MIKQKKVWKVSASITFAVVANILCLLLFVQSFSKSEKNYSLSEATPKISIVLNETQRNDGKVYILFWNKYRGNSSWWMPKEISTEEDLKSVNCPFTNCIFTGKRNVLPNVHDFDAVIINLHSYAIEELPPTRTPRQLYIVGSSEYNFFFELHAGVLTNVHFRAPATMLHDWSRENDVFNLTMTHRLDSDIPWPYCDIVDRTNGNVVAPKINMKWENPDQNFTGKLNLYLNTFLNRE